MDEKDLVDAQAFLGRMAGPAVKKDLAPDAATINGWLTELGQSYEKASPTVKGAVLALLARKETFVGDVNFFTVEVRQHASDVLWAWLDETIKGKP